MAPDDGFGHGHVIPRADGAKARCGGPAICAVCALELQAVTARGPLPPASVVETPADAEPVSVGGDDQGPTDG